jgi:hypothetical protein
MINAINQLCRQIRSEIRYIDHGGCAVFAAFLSQGLEHYGHVGIAVGSDEDADVTIDDARPGVEKNTAPCWNDNGVSFAHVVTEFTYKGTKYHINSQGAQPARKRTHNGRWPILKGRMTVEEVTGIAYCDRGWNYTFNRAQIGPMKILFDKGFKEMFNKGFIPKRRAT